MTTELIRVWRLSSSGLTVTGAVLVLMGWVGVIWRTGIAATLREKEQALALAFFVIALLLTLLTVVVVRIVGAVAMIFEKVRALERELAGPLDEQRESDSG